MIYLVFLYLIVLWIYICYGVRVCRRLERVGKRLKVKNYDLFYFHDIFWWYSGLGSLKLVADNPKPYIKYARKQRRRFHGKQ